MKKSWLFGAVLGFAMPGAAIATEPDRVIDEYQREEERRIAEGEEPPTFPRIEGEIVIEIQNDWQYDASDSDNELNNLFSTTEADFSLFPTAALPGLFVNLHLTWEEVNDNFKGDNRYFASQGLFVENLSLNYEADWWSVIGGKFGPNFSIAFDAAPGIYGTDLAEDDIEIAERIGFGGSLTYDADALGRHALSASTFFLDNSALSGSILYTSRTRVKTNQGGPSNTESLQSFAIAIDGADIAALPGLRYQIGFLHQDVDRVVDENGVALSGSETADENRVVVAGEWAIGVTDAITVTPLLEWVRFWNAEGFDGEDRNYLTAALQLEYENWSVSAATTQRWIDPKGGSATNDHQWSVTAGYRFDFGLQLDVGWKVLTEDGDETRTLGAMASYVIEF
ncbi:MAG: hypothetical protein ACFCUO_01685 [Rhodospirillales bacterium]